MRCHVIKCHVISKNMLLFHLASYHLMSYHSLSHVPLASCPSHGMLVEKYISQYTWDLPINFHDTEPISLGVKFTGMENCFKITGSLLTNWRFLRQLLCYLYGWGSNPWAMANRKDQDKFWSMCKWGILVFVHFLCILNTADAIDWLLCGISAYICT